MIKYSLICECGYQSEAWFASIASYDEQKQKGLVECAVCGSKNVNKAIMAPAIKKRTDNAPPIGAIADAGTNAESLVPEPIKEIMKGWREHISKNYDYVGDSFANEARAIHDGESEARPIYGETTPKEARELIEEGISITPLPPLANPKGDKGVN